MKFNIVWQYLKNSLYQLLLAIDRVFIGLCGITSNRLVTGEIKQEKEKSEQRKRK